MEKLKKRCFIAVDFDTETRNKIKDTQNLLPEFVGKKTETQNIHLTLKFLGSINEEKISLIRKKLKEIKSNEFGANINSIGVFSEKFVRIIWLKIDGCENLQKQIDEKLRGVLKEENRFQGHITIARVKKIKDKHKFLNKISEIKFEPISLNLKNFSLKESVLTEKRPFYKDIEVFDLN